MGEELRLEHHKVKSFCRWNDGCGKRCCSRAWMKVRGESVLLVLEMAALLWGSISCCGVLRSLGKEKASAWVNQVRKQIYLSMVKFSGLSGGTFG